MKKTLSLSLMVIAIASMALSAAFFVKPAGASTAAAAPTQPVAVGQLPADMVVPALLPATIQDPTLLEAWIRLYNHQDAIPLWDGRTLTGRQLAQYLLDHAIPVVWDRDNVCGNGSCGLRYCTADVCTFESGKPGVDPIYVRPGESGDMPSLVATLAHEIFHRTQPFGAVRNTRFEEYWAFRIENHITPEAWLTFGPYDPMIPEHLNLWIQVNGLEPYFQLPEYPASIEPLVNRPTVASAAPDSGLPAAALGNSQVNP